MTRSVATYGSIATNWWGIASPETWAFWASTSIAAKNADPSRMNCGRQPPKKQSAIAIHPRPATMPSA